MTSSIHNNNQWVPDSDVAAAAAATVIDLSVKRVYINHDAYLCAHKFSFKSDWQHLTDFILFMEYTDDGNPTSASWV